MSGASFTTASVRGENVLLAIYYAVHSSFLGSLIDIVERCVGQPLSLVVVNLRVVPRTSPKSVTGVS